MSTICIGTSGWYYDEWDGEFYPDKLPKDERLSYYATYFNTVEVNNTFYGVPKIETLKNWYDSTPANMQFALKAWREITHEKRLHDVKDDLSIFLQNVPVLSNKLAPILFQLPPSLEYDYALLQNFFQDLPPNFRYAIELRHASWHEPDILGLLENANVAFCIFDLKGFHAPMEVTTDFIYLRLHGPNKTPYSGSYSEAYLNDLADFIMDWRAENRDVYCYFDNTRDASAIPNAKYLRERLGSKVKFL